MANAEIRILFAALALGAQLFCGAALAADPGRVSSQLAVSGAVLTITQQPASRAGPSFIVMPIMGAFQGTIAATTPLGWRKT